MKNLGKENNELTDWQSSAILFHNNGSLRNAEKLYRKILGQKPNPDIAANLGALLRTTGRFKEALEHYKKWITIYPEHSVLLLNAINCGIEYNDKSNCRKWVIHGLKYHEHELRMLKAQARVELLQDNNQKAEALLQSLHQQEMKDTDILLDLSFAQLKMKQWANAITSLEKILKQEPLNIKAICNLAKAYIYKNDRTYVKSLIRNLPLHIQCNPQILGIEGDLLIEENKYKESLPIFKLLCKKQPNVPNNWVNQGACYRGLKRPVEALRCVKYGVSIHPGDLLLQKALIQSMCEQGKQEEAKNLLEQQVKTMTNDQLTEVNVSNLHFIANGYQLVKAKALKKIAQQWESKELRNFPNNLCSDHILEPIYGRKIRLAYFSADFSNHPVGQFMLPILESHDRNKIQVIGLDCNSIQDEQNERLKAKCDEWYIVNTKDSFTGAREISDLKLDALVELGGYTSKSKIGTLLYKPCRLQLSYLGYFAPTYLQCIDGWIGDEILFGKLNNIDKIENLIKIEGGYMAYNRSNTGIITNEGRRKVLNIGCFNHSRKINQKTIDLFSDVIKAMNTECKLILKSVSFACKLEQNRVVDMLTKSGLNRNEFTLLKPSKNHIEHLNKYNFVDFVIDPIPYGGATTSCEALLMGVPVVSLSGEGMVGQLSCSILESANCSEWISYSKAEYINISKKLGEKGVRGRKERERLRSKVMNSPLCNTKRLTTQIEKYVISYLKSIENTR